MRSLLIDDGLTFPEGPRWHKGALYLSDQRAHKVLRIGLNGDGTTLVQFDGLPSGLGFPPDGTLLVALMRSAYVRGLDVRTLRHALYSDLSVTGARCLINDMVVDLEAGVVRVGVQIPIFKTPVLVGSAEESWMSEMTEVERTFEERSQGRATHRAIGSVRALIMEHKVLPGQQVRQEELATHLGLSRSPVREALRALEAEGLLVHTANQGYFVVRLSADEMHQIYLMRGVIEPEVLRRIGNVAADDIAELHASNDQLRNAIESQSINQMLEANQRFHFKIFSLSKMSLVKNYLEQVWRLSESYRSTYLWLRETRERILNEHDLMIERLAAKDFEGLVRNADEHRSHAEARVVEILPREDGFRY